MHIPNSTQAWSDNCVEVRASECYVLIIVYSISNRLERPLSLVTLTVYESVKCHGIALCHSQHDISVVRVCGSVRRLLCRARCGALQLYFLVQYCFYCSRPHDTLNYYVLRSSSLKDEMVCLLCTVWPARRAHSKVESRNETPQHQHEAITRTASN